MTFFDRFMLSFIFGYVIGRLIAAMLLRHERRKAESEIQFMGAKKLTKEEMDELMKVLGGKAYDKDDDEKEDE